MTKQKAFEKLITFFEGFLNQIHNYLVIISVYILIKRFKINYV